LITALIVFAAFSFFKPSFIFGGAFDSNQN